MPKTIESLKFDTNLFGFEVGRLVLDKEDLSVLHHRPSLQDILGTAYSTGYKLLYLLGPPEQTVTLTEEGGVVEGEKSDKELYPGTLVDLKTTYQLSLDELDFNELCRNAFQSPHFFIRPLAANEPPNLALLALAVQSGSSSRFKVDPLIPQEGYKKMFETWMVNSCNHSVADEVFVAYSLEGKEIGFISVKKENDNIAHIGLLAVDSNYRRRGIAKGLLGRVALWAVEHLYNDRSNNRLVVVTQGMNKGACACYENFGFECQFVQSVHHIWLPQDLPGPVAQADHAPVPFCRPYHCNKEMAYVGEVISRGMESGGSCQLACRAFLLDSLDPAHCRDVLLVPSCTAALELAAILCDLMPGDEVIMPSYTFSSTANAVVLRGAVPVFVDIRKDTLNIDETLIEAAITSKTKAICVVHYGGVGCEMDEVMRIADKRSLFVIEDAAQGLQGRYRGRPLGSIGHFGCFSFHYTKNIICGEGGALAINNRCSEELARRARIVAEKGTNRHDFVMGRISRYEWIDLGSSFVMNEVACAILLAQLEQADYIYQRRKQHLQRYYQSLQPYADKGLFQLSFVPEHCDPNGHIFFLLFNTSEIRETFQRALREKGVTAFTHFLPLHSSPAGRRYGRVGSGNGSLELTERLYNCVLRLPIWAELPSEDLDLIIQIIATTANSM